jgi:two-component system sensor kinase FixL
MLLRKGQPDNVAVDLNRICRDSAGLLGHDAARRGIRLDLFLDPHLQMVSGDAVQLQQVILNLTLNAFDAAASTAAQDRKVMIGTSARTGEAEIFVRDNGPGLSADVRNHLFESFFTTKPRGLGLGLTIVRIIIERHNGRVSGENGDGGGAVFRVVLPIKSRAERP